MKKPNPVIAQAKKEAYEAGVKAGYWNGFAAGKLGAAEEITSKFKSLDKVPGIGPKTLIKIGNHFGREFLKKVERK